jgi:NADH-quinone oxidoreductase subunit J
MDYTFYISAIVAALSTILVVTRTHAVHALLYLVVSLLAVAVAFYAMGAHFAAALEAITYAGAIMVLFVFVVMMLNLGKEVQEREKRWLRPTTWLGPTALAGILLGEVLYTLQTTPAGGTMGHITPIGTSGQLLFGPWMLAVELSGMLLLAAMVAAYHLGRREAREDIDDA